MKISNSKFQISKYFKTNYVLILLTLLILVGTFLRFNNLNWGSPFYFHPDERNIASSISQLQFPTQMHPHFFAYGSLPIYTIYFTGIVVNGIYNFQFSIFNELVGEQLLVSPVDWLNLTTVKFEMAILVSRFYSAIFSVLLIPLIYFLGRKLSNEKTGLIAAVLSTFSVGLIQYSHFGTFEMWLTFFSVLLFWLCLKLRERRSIILLVSIGLTLGVLIAIKVSSIILLPPSLLLLFIPERNRTDEKKFSYYIKQFLLHKVQALLVVAVLLCIYTATNPYVLKDFSGFKGSMQYESGVALGTLPVFYTGEFLTALPILFHFLFIYPFLLNPLLALLFIPACFYILIVGIKTRNLSLLLLISCYLFLFIPQTFLFAKWTRYVIPTLPFIYLIISLSLVELVELTGKLKYFRGIGRALLSVLLAISIIFAFSFFITVYVQTDTRVQAVAWARKHIPQKAKIASEVYDMGIVPFNPYFQHITLVDSYGLDTNTDPQFLQIENEKIQTSTYVILPSQRIIKTRLQNPDVFPKGTALYKKLLFDTTSYKKIYESPCDIFCKITYLGNPGMSFEETASVFDRPTVYIFEKMK